MEGHINLWGGTIIVVAMFGAFFLVGNFASKDQQKVPQYLLYVCAWELIALDLLLRGIQWRRMVARNRRETVLTPDGPRPPGRRWKQEILQTLLSHESGGQLFVIFPIWLLGLSLWILLHLGLIPV